MRRYSPLIVLAFAACADTGTAPSARETPNFARIHEAEGSHGGAPFMAVLLPTTEVPNPPGGDPSPAASGVMYLTLNSGQEEICFDVTFSGLSAPVSDAHIHTGAEGVRGPVLVPLAQPNNPPFPRATEGAAAQCVYAPREVIKAIRKNPADYYVNVHTRSVPANPVTDRPGGAIRGQLEKTQGSNVNDG